MKFRLIFFTLTIIFNVLFVFGQNKKIKNKEEIHFKYSIDGKTSVDTITLLYDNAGYEIEPGVQNYTIYVKDTIIIDSTSSRIYMYVNYTDGSFLKIIKNITKDSIVEFQIYDQDTIEKKVTVIEGKRKKKFITENYENYRYKFDTYYRENNHKKRLFFNSSIVVIKDSINSLPYSVRYVFNKISRKSTDYAYNSIKKEWFKSSVCKYYTRKNVLKYYIDKSYDVENRKYIKTKTKLRHNKHGETILKVIYNYNLNMTTDKYVYYYEYY